MYVRALTAGVLATAASHVQAQQIDVALHETLTSDPQISAEQAAVRAAEASVDISRSARLPTISIDGRAMLQTDDGLNSLQRRRTYGISARLDLPVYAGGALKWSVRSSQAALRAERAQFEMLVNTRLVTAATGFFSVYRDDIGVAAQTTQVADLEVLLAATLERKRRGDLTETDVQQGVARLAGSKASLARARAALTQSGEDLREITGRHFDTVIIGEPPRIPVGLLVNLPQEMKSFPAVQLADARIEMAAADIKIARAARAPKLYLSSAWQCGNDLSSNTFAPPRFEHAFEFGLNLRVPLYQGGAPRAQIRQAEEVLMARIDSRRAIENEITARIRTQFAQLQAAERSLPEIAVALSASRAALEGVKVQQTIGDRTNLDVLNAQQEVTQFELLLGQARQQRLSLAYSILGQMGKLRGLAESALAVAAVSAARAPHYAVAARMGVKLKFDKCGLWVWKGSTTWSLKPSGATPTNVSSALLT